MEIIRLKVYKLAANKIRAVLQNLRFRSNQPPGPGTGRPRPPADPLYLFFPLRREGSKTNRINRKLAFFLCRIAYGFFLETVSWGPFRPTPCLPQQVQIADLTSTYGLAYGF